MKAFQIIAITLLIISGCSKENYNPGFKDIPVVEGYLHASQPLEISISRQVPYTKEAVYSSDNLDSLNLRIFDGNLFYDLIPIGHGKYINPNINIREFNTFELEFYFNNLLVSTKTNVPEKPKNFFSSTSNIYLNDDLFSVNNPNEIEFYWDNYDESYYYLLIENIEPDPIPIYDNDNISNISQMFQLAPSQSDHYSMKTRRFSYYGNHRIILFHINPDLASLYEESKNTSQNITNPPTEIKHAFGIFTGINADTLNVNVMPQ